MSSNPDPGDVAARGERLQKVLARAGIASRRAAEEMIAQGRVRVDGEVVRVQGLRVDPGTARIEVDGARIAADPSFEYRMLNKPAGVVTTMSDPQGRPTVADLAHSTTRLNPVGRLDIDTTGLLVMTNHGELAHRLSHPRFGVTKTYRAHVRGVPSSAAVRSLTGGVTLEDGPASAVSAKVLRRQGGRAQIEVVMAEGRKREVRRMLEAVGHPVLGLARVAFGPLRLGDLRVGADRTLTPAEVGELLRAVDL